MSNHEKLVFKMPENHSSNEPVDIKDKQKEIIKDLDDLGMAVVFLKDHAKTNTLTKSIVFNGLGHVSAKYNDLYAKLDAEESKRQEDALRANQLRSANMEIHRLKEQVGKGVTNEAVSFKLKAIEKDIYNFWKNLGFLCSTITFSNWACICELSCHIDFYDAKDPDTPEFLSKLETFGERDGFGDRYVANSDRNIEKISEAIVERYPAAEVRETKSFYYNGKPFLRDIRISIAIDSFPDLKEEGQE